MTSFGLALATLGLVLTNIAIGWALAVHFRHGRRHPSATPQPLDGGNVKLVLSDVRNEADDGAPAGPVSTGMVSSQPTIEDDPLEAILPLR